MNVKVLFPLIAAGLLGGCAIAPRHPALQAGALPELIPVRDFVANRESTGGYQLSRDGKFLAWFGVDGITPAILVKDLARGSTKAFRVRARHYVWSADSKYLAILADQSGDENAHVYAGAVEGTDTTLADLTPFPQTAHYIQRVVEGGSDLVIGSNQRDKKVFDLYRLQLATGQISPLATNPGAIGGWGVDRQGVLRARIALTGERSLLQLPDALADGGWRTTAEWSRFETVYPVEFLDDGQHVLALSNRGRDKLAYVKASLATGEESVLFATPDVDIDGVLISRKTQALQVVYSMPDYPRRDTVSEKLKAQLEALTQGQPMRVHVNSVTDDESRMTVSATTDKGSQNFLLNADGSAPQLLGENRLSKLADDLASTKPITYVARDGLPIHGYLTLPVGLPPQGLPMVLLVHGGPWARDVWTAGNTNRSLQQFLANRGYAVLQVNYRGSSGYGRAFQEKAIGEFAGKMHDDLIDGVNWAVAKGVADARRVAIYGASYGGYAALVGATFTPDTFACAVDVVGVSDLARLLETAPPYWELGLTWWKRYVGDPSNPDQRRTMDARSPVYKADQAKIPLLIMHGVNDPRVKIEHSERMVNALQQAGKQVSYLTFKGDGHGNQKWNNNLAMYRKTEDFLASCLGGRSSGFDFYELGAWAF